MANLLEMALERITSLESRMATIERLVNSDILQKGTKTTGKKVKREKRKTFSGYALFGKEQREDPTFDTRFNDFKARETPLAEKPVTKITYIARLWGALTPEDKLEYGEKAKEMKDAYVAETEKATPAIPVVAEPVMAATPVARAGGRRRPGGVPARGRRAPEAPMELSFD